MKDLQFVLGTDIDDQVSHIGGRGMRFWRCSSTEGNFIFLVSSPIVQFMNDAKDSLDYLPRTYVTCDVFEAIRLCDAVPRGNASISVQYRLQVYGDDWRSEAVTRIWGSTRYAATVVETATERLSQPAQSDPEKQDRLRVLYEAVHKTSPQTFSS